MNYKEFLQTKIELSEDSGFEVDINDINPALKPHQRDAVAWALRGAREHSLRASDLVRPFRNSSFYIKS